MHFQLFCFHPSADSIAENVRDQWTQALCNSLKKIKLIILHDYVLRAFDVREKDIWLSVSDQQNYLFRMDEKI